MPKLTKDKTGIRASKREIEEAVQESVHGAADATPQRQPQIETSSPTSEKMPSAELKGMYHGLRRTAESRAAAEPEPEALPLAKGEVQAIGGKSTSPELAALAGRYLNMSNDELYAVFSGLQRVQHPELQPVIKAYEDVRRLAASVLAQVEPSDG